LTGGSLTVKVWPAATSLPHTRRSVRDALGGIFAHHQEARRLRHQHR
jgi:hypothetical protein